MLNLSELEQFVAFADYGTLSRAAEELHISQPTITRTMKRVEDSFGVSLFHRGKNKIVLNETGIQAAECARKLLREAENAVQQIQTFDMRMHTIAVESCAPAPLWSLLPFLSADFPKQTISSRLSELPAIVEDVVSGACDIGILPYPIEQENIICIPLLQEELSICLTPGHELAGNGSVTFEELNGFNCLLRSEIGFWTELCRQKMPASRFLIQPDEFAFHELVRESTLPCFTTNLARDMGNDLQNRKKIPITDPEADVTYHMIYQRKRKEYRAIAEKIRKLL